MPKRPNILVLISHDTGRFISPYGVETVNTPHFERLAAESICFRNAFSASPQCSPARACLFSGMYPHAVGVMGNVGREHGWRFPDNQRHAARILGEAGYQTWLLGMLHETWTPETLGFDTLDLGFTVRAAAEHLEACLETRDRTRPFYCQIGCHETHRPWDREGTPSDDSKGVTVPPYLNDGPATRADMAQMQGAVNRLDAGLGQVLDVLDATGLAEETIVIVTTDHGLALPRAKCTLYDAGLGVLLFCRWPAGGWTAGQSCEALIHHVDVLPTLLDSCGVPAEAQMQGMSFAAFLAGEGPPPRDAVFGEKTFFQFYDPMRSIRTADHLYIRNFELCRILETDSGAARAGSVAELGHRYHGGHPQEELYDLEADPDQMENLAGQEACEAVRLTLAGRLGQWMRATNDPLLRGPVHSPYHQRQVDALLAAAAAGEPTPCP